MGEELITYRRTIKIKFLGKVFKFPLAMREVVLKLPPLTVGRAGLSFVWHFVRGIFVKPIEENSETILQRHDGDVRYKIFFRDYIVRVWGISPAEFSPAFARERNPCLDLFDVLDKFSAAIKNRFMQRTSTEDFTEMVEGNLYTTNKGFSLITQCMGEQIENRTGGFG